MATAKVHRHLAKSQEWLGLEPVDALLLGAFVWLLVTFNSGALLLNSCVVCVGYVCLRVAKRGKPAGYTTALIKYAARSRRAFLSAGARDRDGQKHPWKHSFTERPSNGRSQTAP